MGSLFAIPRIPSVPKSFCGTGHFREGALEDQPVNGMSESIAESSLARWRDRSWSMLLSPTVRRHVDVLLDQVPNRGSHDQCHQLRPPVLEEQLVHRAQGVVSGSGKGSSSLFSDWSFSRSSSSDKRFSNWPVLNPRSIFP